MSWAVAGAGTEKVSCDVAWVLGSEHESARTPRAARGGLILCPTCGDQRWRKPIPSTARRTSISRRRPFKNFELQENPGGSWSLICPPFGGQMTGSMVPIALGPTA